MTSFDSFWKQRHTLVEDRLQVLVPPAETDPRKLHESIRYSLFADAKRIRPVFTLAVAHVFKLNEKDLLNAACAIEMVHTCSLILDDLPCMDGATLRRGKAANHLVFGEDTAVLAAFSLFNRAFGLLAEYQNSFFSPDFSAKLATILYRALGSDGVIGGQMVDLASKGQTIGLETLEFIHSHKTGSLFMACAEMSTSLAKARVPEQQAMLNFAKNLGLAFQITDDILDATGSRETVGKDTGQDRDRTTFISFCGLDGARALANELIDTAVLSLKPLKPRSDLLRSFAEFVRNRTK
jgi:geranylgeranyl diphosphate synthase type II